MSMRIWLDDERPAPDGWTACRWPEEIINILSVQSVEAISLDHDLGDDCRGTGYDVLAWIEEQVHNSQNYVPPEIQIHTANPSARLRMLAAREAIYQKAYLRR